MKDEKGTAVATPKHRASAKVSDFCETSKDMLRFFEYFRYKVGTSLDCALDLGILRNSVTWYIDMLEKENLLQAIYRRPDRTTGFLAKWYSADQSKWRKQSRNLQLSLFD